MGHKGRAEPAGMEHFGRQAGGVGVCGGCPRRGCGGQRLSCLSCSSLALPTAAPCRAWNSRCATLAVVAACSWLPWWPMACGTRRKQAWRACRATSPTPSSWRTSAHPQLPALAMDAAVQGVDFLDGAALVTVMVTCTLQQGEVIVQPAAGALMSRRQKGGSPASPWLRFWGPTATLDTESLHFVFGGRHCAVVAPWSPAARRYMPRRAV